MSSLIAPEQVQTDWIENLALDELNMDESGIIHFDDHLNIDQLLEESSLNLMNQIRDLVEVYTTRFNEYRGKNDQGPQVKVFKISNTVNDFMLFRNSLKLIFARKANDIISIGFLSNTGGLYAARLSHSEPALNKAHEIRAHIGPFNKISWQFHGELLDLDAMARHYLTEFVKNSVR